MCITIQHKPNIYIYIYYRSAILGIIFLGEFGFLILLYLGLWQFKPYTRPTSTYIYIYLLFNIYIYIYIYDLKFLTTNRSNYDFNFWIMHQIFKFIHKLLRLYGSNVLINVLKMSQYYFYPHFHHYAKENLTYQCFIIS